jgi:hypothetical protein
MNTTQLPLNDDDNDYNNNNNNNNNNDSNDKNSSLESLIVNTFLPNLRVCQQIRK